MTAKQSHVLVSWVSVGAKAAPIVTAIKHAPAVLGGETGRLYLCMREAGDDGGQAERASLKETKTQLKRDHPSLKVSVIRWKTREPPTDHGALRPFAEEVLDRARRENPNALIAVHLSPGTPAMHAVWLVLVSSGYLSGPVALLQTSGPRGEAQGLPPLQRIEFNLDSWLQRFRESRPLNGPSDDPGHVWDPSRIRSKAMRDVVQTLRDWAPLRVPVLLLGERGTGKTTLANLLRSMSPFQRCGSDWPTVVCGQFAVNPELARSELFGHARGAFTGAEAPRQGLLERADGDSLFLDEVADLDRETQRLLMAALEGRGFQRLGELKRRQSSFRLICATNRTMADLRKSFLDADFYDRIAVFVLTVPPLRECREDLPAAWSATLRLAATRSGVDVDPQPYSEHPKISSALSDHRLPGNFRDLQRMAYHLLAALNAKKPEREVVKAALDSLPGESCNLVPPEVADVARRLPVDLDEHLGAYKAAWFRAALERTGGNKSKAAKLLGLNRKTFESRLLKSEASSSSPGDVRPS